MTWTGLVLTLAINAAVSWLAAKAWRAIRARRPAVLDTDRLTDGAPMRPVLFLAKDYSAGCATIPFCPARGS